MFTKLAQFITPNPRSGGGSVELPGATDGTTIETSIVNVINWGLLAAGAVTVLIFVVSSFFYITAGGDEKKIERAKSGIRGAITGLIIMLLSAIIVNTINYAVTRDDVRSSVDILDTTITPPNETTNGGNQGSGTTTDPATQCSLTGGLYTCDSNGTNCRCIL
ncbi:MAG: pilin [bacterium]|nr:pilin [bacterium]